MGKASRRKKEKRAQAAAAQKGGKSTKAAKGKKGGKKAKSSKKKPQQPKQAKKITIEALNKKAAALENAFSSVVKKTQQVAAKKNNKKNNKKKKGSKNHHFEAIKTSARQGMENFQQGLDPEKLEKLKKEVRFITRRGSYYLVGIVSVVAILLVVELLSHDRVFAGTTAGGVDIGFLPMGKAQAKLTEEIENYTRQPLIFRFEGDTVEVPLEELDIAIDTQETFARLPSYRFQNENPLHFAVTLLTTRDVATQHTYEEDHVLQALENRLGVTERRARNARLVYGDDGLHIEPEKSGEGIDRERLIADLTTNLGSLNTATIAIQLRPEEPRITAAELEQEKDHLIGLLDNNLTLSAPDASLNMKLLDHLDAVSFDEKGAHNQETLANIMSEERANLAHANPAETEAPAASATSIHIDLDEAKLKDYLHENLVKNIERPVSPAKIYKNEEGKVVIEGKGEDGKSVPHDQLVAAIEHAANTGEEQVTVPVVVDKAPLDIAPELKELGVKELIATGHSAYYGSPGNRMFNIEYGSAKYNGLLIAPGEEFSFNEHLGPVDARSGFLPEKVIKKNKLELEYGGGICQVSTTMYRAALLAGLPITERKPHSWKVSYYGQSMGHGLDATIYPGVADLKFKNDTPGHILIQAYTEGAEAYFKIYGTDDGRQVEMEGPFGGGLSYRWNRLVSKEGEEEPAKEEIWSQYRPIPPPDPVPTPEPEPPMSTDIPDGF